MSERDDFYGLFGEKMREQNAPDFSEQDWPELARQLDLAEQKPPRVWPIGWFWLLVGLLVLSNLGWFFVLKNSNTGLDTAETHVVCDTVFLEKIVVRVDTFFQKTGPISMDLTGRFSENQPSKTNEIQPGFAKISKAKTTQNQVAFSKNQPAIFEKTTAEKPANSPTGNPVLKNGERIFNPDFATKKAALANEFDPFFAKADSLLFSKKGVENGLLSSKSTHSLPFSGLPFLIDGRWPPLVLTHFEPSRPLSINTVASGNSVVPRPARSGWTSLGLVGGRLIPAGYRLLDRRGFMAGLVVERGLTRHLSANLEAAFGGVRCRSFYLDGYGIGGSQIKPPGPAFRLRSFEILDSPKRDLRLGVGLRWRFFPDWKLHPFVGAGWLVDFEKNYDMNTIWYEQGVGGSTVVPVNLPGSRRPISFGEVNGGLEFSFSKHLNLSVSGFYDDKLGLTEHGLPGYAGLKSWLTWRF